MWLPFFFYASSPGKNYITLPCPLAPVIGAGFVAEQHGQSPLYLTQQLRWYSSHVCIAHRF